MNNNNRWSECGGCGGERRWVLHNVRHRAAYRRLCTNCLLKSQQGMFCPFCFQVYEEESLPLAAHERLMCLKCPSISHLSCVPWSHPHSPPSFLCPACSTPNFSFFNLLLDPSSSPTTNNNANAHAILDKDSARALVAAAKIAAVSMTKAAAVARVEAERRVKEAAVAKKRAREALERLAYLAAKDKDRASNRDSSKGINKLSNNTNTNNNKRIQLADGRGGIIISKKEHSTRNGEKKANAGVYSGVSPPVVVNAGVGVAQLKQRH